MSYQQCLRDQEGWHDLPERAARLREQAFVAQKNLDEINELRTKLAKPAQRNEAITKLKANFMSNPGREDLLRLCMEQARIWLEPGEHFDPDSAQKISCLGLDWGQGSGLHELRQIQKIAQIVCETRKLCDGDLCSDVITTPFSILERVAPGSDRQIGQRALLHLLGQTLSRCITSRIWGMVEQIWYTLEQLSTAPELTSQTFVNSFGNGLEKAISDHDQESVRWLWNFARTQENLPDSFWEKPRKQIQYHIDKKIQEAKGCNLKESDKFDAACNLLDEARNLLPTLELASRKEWEQQVDRQLSKIQDDIRSFRSLWQEFDEEVRQGSMTGAIAIISKHTDTLDTRLNNARNANDCTESLVICCEIDEEITNLLKLLEPKQNSPRPLGADPEMSNARRRLRNLQDTVRRAIKMQEELIVSYERAIKEESRGRKIVLFFNLKEKCQNLTATWNNPGVKQLLTESGAYLMSVAEPAYQGLIDFYTLHSTKQTLSTKRFLDDANLLLQFITTNSEDADRLRKIITDAPRDFRP